MRSSSCVAHQGCHAHPALRTGRGRVARARRRAHARGGSLGGHELSGVSAIDPWERRGGLAAAAARGARPRRAAHLPVQRARRRGKGATNQVACNSCHQAVVAVSLGTKAVTTCSRATTAQVAKDTPNKGREYWHCAARTCKFFCWADGGEARLLPIYRLVLLV